VYNSNKDKDYAGKWNQTRSVFTKDTRFLRSVMFNKLKELFFTKTILFIGYNIKDDYINAIIKETKSKFRK